MHAAEASSTYNVVGPVVLVRPDKKGQPSKGCYDLALEDIGPKSSCKLVINFFSFLFKRLSSKFRRKKNERSRTFFLFGARFYTIRFSSSEETT